MLNSLHLLHGIKNILKAVPSSVRLVSLPTGHHQRILWYCRRHCSSSMEGRPRVAVCQMTSTHDKQENMDAVTRLIQDATKENVQMMFFPEACDYLCDNKKDTISFSEAIASGNTVQQYCQLAKKHNVWLSMGGLHEKSHSADNRLYNTHIIINSSGDIVQSYRKLHLFDVEIPERNIRLKESDMAVAGSSCVAPVDSPVGRIGLAVCYDLRFPELSTVLARMGSEILTFPSAFTFATGEAHWETLLRSRAIENQCFVIAAAQVGHHNSKRRSYGHAMVVDPWGVILANCGDASDEPCFAIAELDRDRLREVRQNMPVFQHRRDDVYKILVRSTRDELLPEHSPSYKPENKVEPVLEYADDIASEDCYNFANIKIRLSTVFYETDLSYAFVNLRCVLPGHVLVAPKRIAKRTEDLTSEEISDFFQTVIKVQKVMERVHNARSCNVTVQDGPDAGQTVEHVHCHVIPRHPNDFKDVDMVYTELAKHDASPVGKDSGPKPPRKLAEMREEASMLRKYFT